MSSGRRRIWIVFVVLATTLAGRVPLAQAQEQAQTQAQAQKGPTLRGHMGYVLPMVTHSGGQTTNDLTDAFAVGFPVGITVKGSGRLAFDLELSTSSAPIQLMAKASLKLSAFLCKN
jgi:hypothetical protein